MKTICRNITGNSKKANMVRYTWKLVALCIPVVVVALMLVGASLIKDKAKMNYHVRNSYNAGDMALFVAMPLLNVVVK